MSKNRSNKPRPAKVVAPTVQPEPPQQRSWSSKLSQPAVIVLLLAVAAIAVYWPVTDFEFINFDDPHYVSENPHVQPGLTKRGITWAFTTGHASNWHPLTWLTHMADVEIFGNRAGGHHLTNLLFHAANTMLLFLLLRQMTGALWRSAFVAALFALHPLHVESVAWISERKDVLSTFFGFLCLIFYGRYAQSRAAGARSDLKSYALALLFFAFGLMSKPMLVTLPFVLLLLDYWPLNRIAPYETDAGNPRTREPKSTVADILRLIPEKIPFLVLALASSVATFLVQQKGGAVQSLAGMPLSERLQNAPVSYARYLGKTFWPVELAIPYPHPGTWPAWLVASSVLLLVVLCLLAVWFGRRQRYLFTGWFVFFGMLVPVIGLVQVGAQSMADRYTYVPLVGVFICIAWGAAEALRRINVLKPALIAAAAAVLIACALRTSDQLGHWRNSGALARHTIEATERNDIAFSNLGNYYLETGQLDEAIENLRKALRLMWSEADAPADPAAAILEMAGQNKAEGGKAEIPVGIIPSKRTVGADILNNVGTALSRQGKRDEALQQFRAALLMKPGQSLALYNIGYELAAQGRSAEAIEYYEAALRDGEDEPRIRNSLGLALVQVGRIDEAIARYQEVLRAFPANAEAHNNLGLALMVKGQPTEAIPHYQTALRLDPGMIEIHNNLASVLISIGKLDEGIQELETLLKLNPTHARAHDNLGVALASQGKLDEAIAHLREAVRLQPETANTHFNLGNVLAMQRKRAEAAEAYRETLRLVPNHAQAHCHLGAVLAEQGHIAEAVSHLKEALRLKPDYETARQQLRALGAAAQ